MPPVVKKFFDQTRTVIMGMSVKARIFVASVVLIVAGLLAFVVFGDHTVWSPLFTGLSTEDAASIADALRKNNVPFRLDNSETAILVPADKVHETRLSMAGQGLPRGGGVGFEIFDNQKFGISDFAQQLNYRRALQGELERTISQIDVVKAVRVHIAMPERQLFARKQQQVSASITIKLQPNRTLPQPSVNAIVHLVASSVPGLAPTEITLVDTSGNMLWSGHQGAAGGGSNVTDTKRTLEQSMERRVTEILDAALGAGHGVVKITAELGISQIEQTDTQYDPDKVAVRSETTLEEKESKGGQTPAGIPGVRANLPGGPQPESGASGAGSNRKSITRNYEINQMIRKKSTPAGELQRLSVAVLVDTKAVNGGPAAALKEGQPAAPAREPVNIKALEEVVKQAVGFNPTRGDVVTLQAVPFAPEPELETTGPNWAVSFLKNNSQQLITTILVGTLVIVVLMMVLRGRKQQFVEILELPKTVRELEATGTAPVRGTLAAAPTDGRIPPKDLANAAAEHDAARAAAVVRSWISSQ